MKDRMIGKIFNINTLLLDQVDDYLAMTGESFSKFVRDLIEEKLASEEKKIKVDDFE